MKTAGLRCHSWARSWRSSVARRRPTVTTRRSHDRQTRQRPRQRRRTRRRRRRRTSACRGRPTPAPASHLSLLPGGRTYLGFENLAQGVHRGSNLETTQLKFDQSCGDRVINKQDHVVLQVSGDFINLKNSTKVDLAFKQTKDESLPRHQLFCTFAQETEPSDPNVPHVFCNFEPRFLLMKIYTMIMYVQCTLNVHFFSIRRAPNWQGVSGQSSYPPKTSLPSRPLYQGRILFSDSLRASCVGYDLYRFF